MLLQLETAVGSMNDSKDQQNHDMKSFKDELESVMERVEEINEKMYDFEANKRNNLIFYGIPNEVKEVQPALLQKITHIIRTSLGIRRDIPVAKVGQDCFFILHHRHQMDQVCRMHTGPEVGGCKPTLGLEKRFTNIFV